MTQPLQLTLLGLAISVILTAFSVNAETGKTTNSQVNYSYYHADEILRHFYHQNLPFTAPEGVYYHIQLIAIVNIDDTPEKEVILLIVAGTKPRPDFFHPDFDDWHQAFLFILEHKAENPKRKALFKLFDTKTHPLEVPPAKSIELHRSPFSDLKQPINVSFRLADLTDNGILDIWVESAHGVALISFENGEFAEVFTNDTITREKLTEIPEVEHYTYDRYYPKKQKYYRFLPSPVSEKIQRYNTWSLTAANIDDTPEKENIVLITAETDMRERESLQAFLLITEDAPDGMKKKELFKIFTAGHYEFDVPGKSIAIQSAPFVFREPSRSNSWSSGYLWFELVDLTGDGILDIWLKSYNGVVVISFQDGEFVEVCSAYSSIRREEPIEYIDLDNDDIYEIKVPDRISIDGIPGASYPQWVSLYEWDGNTYVLNNQRFYAHNDDFLTWLLDMHNTRFGKNQEYHFYIGLVYYYRDNIPLAKKYLHWVVENGKNDDYIRAAKDLLKKLPSD